MNVKNKSCHVCLSKYSTVCRDNDDLCAVLAGTNRTWQHIANCLEGRAASQCFVR